MRWHVCRLKDNTFFQHKNCIVRSVHFSNGPRTHTKERKQTTQKKKKLIIHRRPNGGYGRRCYFAFFWATVSVAATATVPVVYSECVSNTYRYSCPKLKWALTCFDAYSMAERKWLSASSKSLTKVPKLLCALEYVGHNLLPQPDRTIKMTDERKKRINFSSCSVYAMLATVCNGGRRCVASNSRIMCVMWI